MNNPENPNESAQPSGEEQQPTRRKARRATRPAMAPEPETTVEEKPNISETTSEKKIDVLAELGDQIEAKDPPKPSATAEMSLDDLVLPERDNNRGKQKQPKPDEDTTEDDQRQETRLPATALLFQAPQPTSRPAPAKVEEQPAKTEETEDPQETEGAEERPRRRRRRGGRGRRRGGGQGQENQEEDKPQEEEKSQPEVKEKQEEESPAADQEQQETSSSRRRRRRSRSESSQSARDQVTPLKGSTRLEAKRQRRRDGRDSRRRRSVITEAEFLARRESVERKMYVREIEGRTQIVVLEDGVLVEHYVAQKGQTSYVGNIYLGRVQNVLPSMEAAFVDIGRGRNAVLYAGEVNWDAAGLEGQPRKIEQALKSGDFVLVQVTKDPIGTKGARLTAQVTLAGRFLVLVPGGSMTGISRKLPEGERNRLKKLLKDLVPEGQGVIVRTAAEGASEEQLKRDIERLSSQWAEIEKKQQKGTTQPVLLKGEPELATRVVRDIFNEDFSELVISGQTAWKTLSEYVNSVAPDLSERLTKWTKREDVFAAHRIDEQLTKGTDRKVYLPSGGSLVIDRTEAMTVIDVNTGKYTGSGGTLEETVTKNNLEAAEEIVRQLRLRDIGGIIVIDFIDMVLESNRELVLRRLVECLGRDRTRHQVAEVTSLGLVQMTRKRVGQGLVEAFSTPCECCNGRGFIVDNDPFAEKSSNGKNSKKNTPRKDAAKKAQTAPKESAEESGREEIKATLQAIAQAASTAGEEKPE